MRRSATIGALGLVIAVLAAACSVDVTNSDEYRTLEVELKIASEAHEEALALADEARLDVDEARAEAKDAQAEVVAANSQALKAETALEEAMNVEWPDTLRRLFVDGCIEESESPTEDLVICSCLIDELESQMSLVDFLLLSVEVADSGAELNEFGFPLDADPEFAAAMGNATVTCLFGTSSRTIKLVVDLEPGDCFNDSSVPSDNKSVILLGCSNPHDNEIYAIFEIPGEKWPGEDTVADWSETHCLEAFESYVDTRWESSVLDFGWFFPLEESWVKYDDRTVACILFDAEFEKLTSSMKGTST
jgi:hypothetical protein